MNSPLTQQVSAPAPWIWANPAPVGPNVFCGFRRTFSLERPIDLTLQISADSRYWLYVNGRRIGFGPLEVGSSTGRSIRIRCLPICARGGTFSLCS